MQKERHVGTWVLFMNVSVNSIKQCNRILSPESWYRKRDWKQRFSRGTCVNLGDAYHSRHEFQEAMKFFQWGLGIAIETRNKDLEGAAKMNIGVVYRSLGDIKKAIEFFEHSLSIAKEVRNKPLEGDVYRNLGFAYQDLGLFKNCN